MTALLGASPWVPITTSARSATPRREVQPFARDGVPLPGDAHAREVRLPDRPPGAVTPPAPEARPIPGTMPRLAQLLTHAGSALGQTAPDLEVLVVGDGADAATREAAPALARSDASGPVLRPPEGTAPRPGAPARRAPARARRIVRDLADDDLWLPDHVEAMARLLGEADFAHALPIAIGIDGAAQVPGGATWRSRGSALTWRLRHRLLRHRRLAAWPRWATRRGSALAAP